MISFRWIDALNNIIDFSDPKYTLLDTYDLGGIVVDHMTVKAPFQHGSLLTNSSLGEGLITLEYLIECASAADLDILRRQLKSAFNPINGAGILEYTSEDGLVLMANCSIQSGSPMFGKDANNRFNNWSTMRLDFVQHDPFWYSATTHIDYFAPTPAAFYPFGFPFSLGWNSSTKVLTNNGSIAAPVTITIYGEVTDPVLTNVTTGEAISIDKIMASGDKMVITTGVGNKTITYTPSGGSAANGFQYLLSSSVLWDLEPGENEVTLTNASIGTTTYVSIEWQDKFIGV